MLVGLVGICLSLNLLGKLSYSRFNTGVCRANLIAYTQNRSNENNLDTIAERVRDDLRRDNISVCDDIPYSIEYDESKNLITLCIENERIIIPSKPQ